MALPRGAWFAGLKKLSGKSIWLPGWPHCVERRTIGTWVPSHNFKSEKFSLHNNTFKTNYSLALDLFLKGSRNPYPSVTSSATWSQSGGMTTVTDLRWKLLSVEENMRSERASMSVWAVNLHYLQRYIFIEWIQLVRYVLAWMVSKNATVSSGSVPSSPTETW